MLHSAERLAAETAPTLLAGPAMSGLAPPPDAETFGTTLSADAPRNRAFKQLHGLLGELDPVAPLERRLQQLEALARWLRANGKLPAVNGGEPGDRPQVGRLRALVLALERFDAYRHSLGGVVAATLAETSALHLLGRLGLPAERGFFGETMDRLSRRFLPEPIDEHDFGQFVAHALPSRRDLIWLSSVPPELAVRFALVLRGRKDDPSIWAPLSAAAADALSLIAVRVSSVGLYDSLRARSPACPLQQSPFFKLPRATDQLLESLREQAGIAVAAEQCRELVARCRELVASVIQNLEHSGVSVDVVYRLELITKNLRRYELLLDQTVATNDADRYTQAKRLLVTLVELRLDDHDLAKIARSNLHLLARKIIERAGDTGEHYITTTRGEYAKMLVSAGGGGFLTTGTTALKYIIGWGKFAPFVEGALSAMNYAGSFLVMQSLGCTLATKQPSMTAAALAESMRERGSQKDLTGLVNMIARITRSQLAAAIGNIGVVIPTAVGFELLHRRFFGQPFLDPDTAAYVMHSLHPTQSGTIFFAALTGVLLWISSIGAGWLENWAVYRRLPEAIAEHRIGRIIGRRATRWASRVFAHNISGVGGNVTLGVLLGMTPIAGKFFGLPLDVRHVTLSTGALTLAACALGTGALRTPEFIGAAAGIAVIGMLNFGVSFVLALAVALRAREVDRRDRLRLWASVVITFIRSPLQFVLPPRAPLESPVHGPVSVPPPPRPNH